MMIKNQFVDLVDENDQVIGQISEKESTFSKDKITRAVVIFLKVAAGQKNEFEFFNQFFTRSSLKSSSSSNPKAEKRIGKMIFLWKFPDAVQELNLSRQCK